MKKKLTIIIIPLLIIYSIGITYTLGFKDVTNDKWYWEAVNEISNNGIMTGFTDNTFKPEKYVTRAELAQVILNTIEFEQNEIKQETANIVSKMKYSAYIETDTEIASGVVISKNTVLTAYHVVEKVINGGRLYVSVGYKEFDGKVISFDKERDLALIQVDGDLNYITIAKHEPNYLDNIYIIGNPLGFENSFSYGVLSNISVYVDGKTVNQIDANINAGNSGGMVLNKDGELIGIVLSKVEYQQATGMAFIARLVDIQIFLNKW